MNHTSLLRFSAYEAHQSVQGKRLAGKVQSSGADVWRMEIQRLRAFPLDSEGSGMPMLQAHYDIGHASTVLQ